MSPASGPVTDPKLIPAATMEDQEGIVEGSLGERTVLGTVPFSSPDPATDAIKMLPLSDGTSAHQAALDAAETRESGLSTNYKKMSNDELKALVESREIGDIEGTGKKGNVVHDDYVAALEADDAKDMNSTKWKEAVAAATTTEELDALAEKYDNSGAEYSTVEAAFDTRYEELGQNA